MQTLQITFPKQDCSWAFALLSLAGAQLVQLIKQTGHFTVKVNVSKEQQANLANAFTQCKDVTPLLTALRQEQRQWR